MPKHFLKCDLVKTTPFDKEPIKIDGVVRFDVEDIKVFMNTFKKI